MQWRLIEIIPRFYEAKLRRCSNWDSTVVHRSTWKPLSGVVNGWALITPD